MKKADRYDNKDFPTGIMMLQTSLRMSAEESRCSKNRNAATVTSAMLTCMLQGKPDLATAIPVQIWLSSATLLSPGCCPFCRSCIPSAL